jgi:hypothetical protein
MTAFFIVSAVETSNFTEDNSYLKKIAYFLKYPNSGRFIVDTLYDKIGGFHCIHPV